MIIVSQNKKTIINFENIVDIHMYEFGDVVKIIVENNEIDIGVGEYKTEERAKKILKEIVIRYKNWENLKAGQPDGICLPIYEMPED